MKLHTEITAENLELKKTLGLQGRVRLSAQTKQDVLAVVEQPQPRSEWPLLPILACLGVLLHSSGPVHDALAKPIPDLFQEFRNRVA